MMREGAVDAGMYAAFAGELADSARAITLHYFRQPLQVEAKADLSPVTLADRECEALMRRKISEAYPDHGILGEEHGEQSLEQDLVWVLDPIDGTRSFISGNPLFGTMISLFHRWQPVVTVIDMPVLDERWVAIAGQGVSLNGRQCKASRCERLSEAIAYTTSIDSFEGNDREDFDRVSRQARLRRFGGDCYSFGLLAAGHVDLVFGGALEPYDFLPLMALVEAAGGRMTDWQGRKPGPTMRRLNVVCSATPALHAEALQALGARTRR